MLNHTPRVEGAADERPGERERLRGIKRDDAVKRPVRSNRAVCEHGVCCVQSQRSPVRTRCRDICRYRAPWQTCIRNIVDVGRRIRSQGADEIVPRYVVRDEKALSENAFVWRKRAGTGADAGAGTSARAGTRSSGGAGTRSSGGAGTRSSGGAGTSTGAGTWCWTTSGVAEKNLDCNLISKQRLVNPNSLRNHRLNDRRVWVINDRAVECWMND